MTREEAKKVFLNRGFIEVDGGTIFDGNKWREACYVISQWLNQEPCEDAISRQIISDYVQSHIQEINTGYGDLNKHTNEILRMIVDYIEKMESVTLQQARWIPVSERLPEETIYKEFIDPSEPVLIQLNNGEMEVSRYWGSRESYKDKPWIDLSYPTTLKVIAWMPLPKPYKPQESEK